MAENRKLVAESKVKKLHELHSLIVSSAIKTIYTAIEAGGILTEIKQELPHGKFTSWCERNLSFNIRTAQRYMRCYALKDRLLKNDSVTFLTDAYGLLEIHRDIPTLKRIELAIKTLKDVLDSIPTITDVGTLIEIEKAVIRIESHAMELHLNAARELGGII